VTDDPPRYQPWLTIPAADYEGHMDAPAVGQLAALGDAFAEIYDSTMPQRLLIIGCATGNGLEHVDDGVTGRVVGLDINPGYLEIARERFQGSVSGLELICADVEQHRFAPGSFDLIFAGLVLEYVDPQVVLARAARWLAPGGTLRAVLQLASESHGAITETGIKSIETLAPIMRLLRRSELRQYAARAGLAVAGEQTVTLPSGKRFHLADFSR
jgi:ubiquinone/menaquinone biosynthesis C-methylase UbiE